MPTRRRHRFLVLQVGWMLGVVVLLALLRTLTLTFFFVGSLVGFLLVTAFTASPTVRPRWRSRLKWVAVVGLVAFVYVLLRRVQELVGVA
jgi:hypothetical protein